MVADTALAAGETSLVKITFSEAVTGLSLADMTVANGTPTLALQGLFVLHQLSPLLVPVK